MKAAWTCVVITIAWILVIRLSNPDLTETRLMFEYRWHWIGIVAVSVIGVLCARRHSEGEQRRRWMRRHREMK